MTSLEAAAVLDRPTVASRRQQGWVELTSDGSALSKRYGVPVESFDGWPNPVYYTPGWVMELFNNWPLPMAGLAGHANKMHFNRAVIVHTIALAKDSEDPLQTVRAVTSAAALGGIEAAESLICELKRC